MDRTGGRDGNRGVAAEEVRRHNLGTVLEQVHLAGPVSRSELSATTGLNRSTIADLIGELTTLGLVAEGPGPPTGNGPGRPSAIVQARPQGATVLAVELSVDSIAVATVGLGGHVYDRVRVARPRSRFSPEETVQDVVRLAAPLLDSLPADHVLAGVGAAIVGVVRRSDGFVHLAPNLGWNGVPLGALLAGALGSTVPVLVANDADLGALAEHRRGAHRGAGHLVYVSGEVGIGIGVIVDGAALLGSAGFAGEAGHTLVDPSGQRCRCGAVGCWETEAGEAALLRGAGLPSRSTGLAAVDLVVERARAGDRRTLDAITRVGHWLGIGIGNLINILNPEVVVLGGLYQRLYPHLEAAVDEGIAGRALAAPRELATLACSELGADATLIGAAELVLGEVTLDPAGIAKVAVGA